MNARTGDGRVLLCDLGGTNVRFALADTRQENPLVQATIRHYRVADFVTFEDAARAYLGALDARPGRAVFAVAGPVTGDEVRMTNNPWVLSVMHLDDALGMRVCIVNDFVAMSHCIASLGRDDMVTIGAIAARRVDLSKRQAFAIIGPGTGLGVGALVVQDGKVVVLATEGGHVGFAPGDLLEVEILRRMFARFDRVSAERLLCGMGLVNLHRTLGEIDGLDSSVEHPQSITAHASDDPRCRATIERFCAMLGSIAGDYALAFGAWDGVYIAGGLVPILLQFLQQGEFRRRFNAKGRYAELLASVPTTAIVHPDAGLLGAAALAVLQNEAGVGDPIAAHECGGTSAA